jgi:DNA-directed RNA polymerase subunit alpha
MAILAFQKPDKVIMLEADNFYGKFEFRPLEPGYGITIGNALRRILLSSLEGFAITAIKIDGVDHEYSTIPGVIDDVANIILNLKQVRFKQIVEDIETEKVTVNVTSGNTKLLAGDIGKCFTGFEVLNPELVICEMDSSASFQMDVYVNKGRGYVTAEENALVVDGELGIIHVDSIFTPIKNVKYTIEDFRVEQITDYEKLTIEIDTDGSIFPKDALNEAAKILIHHFMLFSDEKISVETAETETHDDFDEEYLQLRQLLKTKLVDLELSVRALNCLKAADVESLGQLVTYNRHDLLKFRNFGKKSLAELEEKLEGLNLTFGMDISKYKLDKE